MGLALARTAARAMDGDVVLETSGPEGSTFLWTIASRLIGASTRGRQVNRRMWTFSSSPTAAKFAAASSRRRTRTVTGCP